MCKIKAKKFAPSREWHTAVNLDNQWLHLDFGGWWCTVTLDYKDIFTFTLIPL